MATHWGYYDRREAGQVLAQRLSAYAGRGDVLVSALPRGGVPVAREVASVLGAPLDIRVPPWTRDPQGYYMGGNQMALTPRAMLRIGELVRRRGRCPRPRPTRA